MLCITNNSIKYQSVLFQIIQFSISYLFALSLNVKQGIGPIDRTLSSATTPGQIRPESNSNEGVLHIPQRSSTGFVSYLVTCWRGPAPLQKCNRCILRPQPTGLVWLGGFRLFFRADFHGLKLISLIFFFFFGGESFSFMQHYYGNCQ